MSSVAIPSGSIAASPTTGWDDTSWIRPSSMARAAGVGIGIHNLGGVRADLPAGELTFAQVFEVLPFDNRVARLDLTGAQLRAFVRHLSSRRQGQRPLVTGLTFEKGEADVRLADGTPISDQTLYGVATNDFLATGATILGLARLAQVAGAVIVGVGALIEKIFEGGRHALADLDVPVKSLAVILEMQGDRIVFED